MAEELRILYEDPYLVVCVKPVGVLSEDSESGRSLPRMLAEHYRQAGKPDYIATVHRLDKIVGGVMVLSRRREVTGRLTTAIAAHEITKEYLAVLLGDIRYGSKAPGCTAALWSYHLGFRHPATGKPVDVTCPPPQVYPWDLFGGVK